MKNKKGKQDTDAYTRHGGDIYRHPVKIDFSVNVNPLGMPDEITHALQNAIGHCNRYPDYHCEQLINKLSQKTKLRKEQILLGNGASDLFLGIVHALCPKKAVVFAPSFYGYTYALQAVSCEIQYEYLQERDFFHIQKDVTDRITPDMDMLFLCVPNNPTGVVPDKEVILRILTKCRQLGMTVVYDECFLEFTNRYAELCGEQFLAEYPNLIVVNAFTKTYAIPGIRLGMAYASAEMIDRIAPHLAEWRVSVLAMAAGMAALEAEEKTDYLIRTRSLLEAERAYMIRQMKKLGIVSFASEADYLLLKSQLPLYEKLLQEGILIRSCDNYVGLSADFYRIAVKTHEENQALIQQLRLWKEAGYESPFVKEQK